MEIVGYISSIVTFSYIAYVFGASSIKIEASELSKSEAFKEGYIKGYADCWAAKESDKKYYDKFPPMGTN